MAKLILDIQVDKKETVYSGTLLQLQGMTNNVVTVAKQDITGFSIEQKANTTIRVLNIHTKHNYTLQVEYRLSKSANNAYDQIDALMEYINI